MSSKINPTLSMAAALTVAIFPCHRAGAQVTVTSEWVTTSPSTTGTFVFPTVPSNSSEDIAHGKSFTILAGTPSSVSAPISVLTNGPAQTASDLLRDASNQLLPPGQQETFFANGNSPDGTHLMRIQIDLERPHSISQINTYSWHANARAPQIYKVYGATSPSNSFPNFTHAAFRDDTALAALGYSLIADVRTAQNSGGQWGVSLSGAIGLHRYLLFDLSPPGSATQPRPTFFGEIDIHGTPAAFPLTIRPASLPAGGFDLAWESRPARSYRLRTSTDPGTALAEWGVVADQLAATPPLNTYNVPQDGPRRFYVVEELPLPPLLSADFEQDNGGFTVITTQGSAWAYGTPASGSAESPNIGGFVSGGNGGSAKCWGTNIGNPGYYVPPTSTRLRSPVIDLRSVAGARLTFAQALDLEAGDTAVINLIAADSGAIIASAIYTATDPNANASPWTAVPSISLAAAIGQEVQIEWSFSGQTGEDYMGWYIDDVVVTATAP